MSFYSEHVRSDLAQREAGYVNHPSDRGGPTKYGITEKVARKHGYTGDMRDFPLDLADQILEREYVEEPGFDLVAVLSVKVAKELVDTGVNCGTNTAAMFFQRVLNVMNGKGAFWPELKVDGQIGRASIAAFRAYLDRRGAQGGELVMLRALNSLQGARYVSIAENIPDNEDFVFGWFANRVVI
ncbi:glycosylhydrolase [Caulobacter phage Jess A]|nr:glycosylhydrolase [Caulobacter phage Jess A]WCA46443.1 glycosylhydrolase [Caulobacter phage RapA]